MTTPKYVGSELDLFARAANWKRYWKSLIEPYVRGRVLDVGAGIGSTAQLFAGHASSRWTCLEPDVDLAHRLDECRRNGELANVERVLTGTTGDLPAAQFDAVLYIDVLEHIEDDRAELARAAGLLAKGAHLIVLAPAHNALLSPFDQAVGHCRRYTKATLRALDPAGCRLEKLVYVDSLGFFLSLANSRLLKSAMPNARQIAFWDRVVVPISRRLDPLLGHAAGKTVIGIWEKTWPLV